MCPPEHYVQAYLSFRVNLSFENDLECVGYEDDGSATLDDVLHVVKLHVVVQHQLGGVQPPVQSVVAGHHRYFTSIGSQL